MNKPPKALLTAIDQMERLPGIAGVFSEVRLQIFHREAMRKEDWAYITSSGWLYAVPLDAGDFILVRARGRRKPGAAGLCFVLAFQ